MKYTQYLDASQIDFGRFLRPGDMVTWGQASAEPQTLTEQLMVQRAEAGPFRCFLGIPATRTVRPEHADHISFVSYCGSGGNRALFRAGVLDIVPVHYSTLPDLLTRGPLAVDVLLLQLPPSDENGRYSVGLADDYLLAALTTARVVIAEVNDQVPRTYGRRSLTDRDLDIVVRTSRPPAQLAPRPTDDVTLRIAQNAAQMIDDGATLQFGIGAIPEAVLAALGDRSDLGIHSGLLNDTAADLMDRGVITNERKSLDRGRAVAGVLMGTQRLFRFADRNRAIELRDTRYTHAPAVLAGQDRLAAINSAIEVDLTGQINAEVAAGDYVGAIGGGADFLRGAARSRGGLPIIALPATAGTASRIVPSLTGPVSTARSDAGIVVTEFGVADLRCRPLQERRELMVALAHPDHRPALEKAIEKPGVLL
ncbi:acetyl-CoA hydrolase/transferase family protein [Nocardia neocaledoniensis]|uniref:acetyl-CoA hydrolase/transferase family protein n=1 Tax=Nocardia neocaledoniensis TaxID=236511 RepID=UPI00245546CE|nr:acetyl-CoA hydrolase/transferase C-terminal domain-containing protein [Nocardia neocaledoniensis]